MIIKLLLRFIIVLILLIVSIILLFLGPPNRGWNDAQLIERVVKSSQYSNACGKCNIGSTENGAFNAKEQSDCINNCVRYGNIELSTIRYNQGVFSRDKHISEVAHGFRAYA